MLSVNLSLLVQLGNAVTTALVHTGMHLLLLLPLIRCSAVQVTEVFEKHKGEGIHGVVNLMGDYQYCPMNDLEEADLMTIMQVGCYPVKLSDCILLHAVYDSGWTDHSCMYVLLRRQIS